MARASALHAEGQGFDSLILHQKENGTRATKTKKKFFKGKKYWNERDRAAGVLLIRVRIL